MSHEERARQLAELRASRPAPADWTPAALLPPPAVVSEYDPAICGYGRFDSFAQRALHFDFVARRWRKGLGAWRRMAVKHGDRPLLDDGTLVTLHAAWLWEAYVNLFTTEPPHTLSDLDSLIVWGQVARDPLRTFTANHHLLIRPRLFMLDEPPARSETGLILIGGGVARAEEFHWPAVPLAFGCLAEERPLTTDEQGRVRRLAVWFNPERDTATLADLVADVARQTWDAMRRLPTLAPVEPPPRVQSPPTPECVDAIFDGLARWVHKASETRQREQPQKPTDVNVVSAASGAFRGLTEQFQQAGAVKPKKEPPTVWYHGERGYSSDRLTPVTVGGDEHAFLQAFLNNPTSMTTDDLTRSPHFVGNPSRAFANLKKRFKSALSSGGKKGNGGYFARVLKANSAP